MPSTPDPRLNVLPSAPPTISSLPVLLTTPEPTQSDSTRYASFPPLGSGVKVLMVWPSFPPSFWGFEGVLQMIPERAMTPPLGLITVAALCPATWEIRLIDHAFEELRDEDLAMGRPGDGKRHARPACRCTDRPRPALALWDERTFVGGPWASTRSRGGAAGGRSRDGGRGGRGLSWNCRRTRKRDGTRVVPHCRQARHDAQPGASLRPAAARQIHFDADPVLPRMPVPVRILRHHHHLRSPAARQNAHASHSRARCTAQPGLAQRSIHRR